MDDNGRSLENVDDRCKNNIEDDMGLRRGPWTADEDFKLIESVASLGEGRWNSLARCAGLKRTGKSCRLRWLNYLRPDVRRGNITLEEQLLILELHSRWGNRWSKIAQYLPGRTDNEIKNYWRTRVQKHAKQLKCDVNSKQFKDTVRYLWMPRLVERIRAAETALATGNTSSCLTDSADHSMTSSYGVGSTVRNVANDMQYMNNAGRNPNTSENSSVAVSPASDLSEYYNAQNLNPSSNPEIYYPGDGVEQIGNHYYSDQNLFGPTMLPDNLFSYNHNNGPALDESFPAVHEQSNFWVENGGSSDSLWNIDGDEDFWFLQQQHLNNGSCMLKGQRTN